MKKGSATPPPQNGLHQELFANGTVSVSGHYADGAKAGEWQYFYLKSGQVKAAGLFVAGQMHGGWEWYREDGTLMQTGAFDHGVRTGIWRRYHPNGKLADEGGYHGERKTGAWKSYDTEGNLTKTQQHLPK